MGINSEEDNIMTQIYYILSALLVAATLILMAIESNAVELCKGTIDYQQCIDANY